MPSSIENLSIGGRYYTIFNMPLNISEKIKEKNLKQEQEEERNDRKMMEMYKEERQDEERKREKSNMNAFFRNHLVTLIIILSMGPLLFGKLNKSIILSYSSGNKSKTIKASTISAIKEPAFPITLCIV